ncbi:hypothetical protein [Rothia sp. (in: high G+C Gram-positive bacteria)]|uniref:hypothetical protein n=1 Tax=Rothia sp. (in: high G+C Gram-positive bacteria) TaxID=1885016 RepID=UPI0026DC3C1F|nr:hypothetical protein [Rothia sp. (in: high G+C Gram-positive bacteria)]
MSRRSLLLGVGCAAAAGFVTFLPAIASTGMLGEEAAATVSNGRRLAKWERDIREHINTEYLVLEEISRIYSGESRDEDSQRLVARIGLTDAGRANISATAAALAALGEYGRPQRVSIVQNEKIPVIDVYRFASIVENEWVKILHAAQSFSGKSTDALEATTSSEEGVVVTARITTGPWADGIARFRDLKTVKLPEQITARYRLNLKDTPLPSGTTAEVRVDVVGTEHVSAVAGALEAAAKRGDFRTLTTFSLVWLGDTAQQKDRVLRLDFKRENEPKNLATGCKKYFSKWLSKLPAGTEASAYHGGEKIAIDSA